MMPRKFRVLQIGGDDLEPIFQHKKGVSWDYFDIGLFEFDSGYVEAIEAIVEAKGALILSIFKHHTRRH